MIDSKPELKEDSLKDKEAPVANIDPEAFFLQLCKMLIDVANGSYKSLEGISKKHLGLMLGHIYESVEMQGTKCTRFWEPSNCIVCFHQFNEKSAYHGCKAHILPIDIIKVTIKPNKEQSFFSKLLGKKTPLENPNHYTNYMLACMICEHQEKVRSLNPKWIHCTNKKCRYGCLFDEESNGKKFNCKCCGRENLMKKKEESHAEMKEQLKILGIEIRDCPKCKLPTMKDFGICNVIQCAGCKIFWNWKSRETGRSSGELKNRARRNGTLWEPGELNYQLNLQRTNLPAFIKLIEDNGGKYDPNFRRGMD